jgi:hypothetical protein
MQIARRRAITPGMILIALHVLAISALGVLVRRRLASSTNSRRLLSATAGGSVAVLFLDTTQARVYDVVHGTDRVADMLAAAGPAGDFAGVVLLAVALTLLPAPWARERPAPARA